MCSDSVPLCPTRETPLPEREVRKPAVHPARMKGSCPLSRILPWERLRVRGTDTLQAPTAAVFIAGQIERRPQNNDPTRAAGNALMKINIGKNSALCAGMLHFLSEEPPKIPTAIVGFSKKKSLRYSTTIELSSYPKAILTVHRVAFGQQEIFWGAGSAGLTGNGPYQISAEELSNDRLYPQ